VGGYSLIKGWLSKGSSKGNFCKFMVDLLIETDVLIRSMYSGGMSCDSLDGEIFLLSLFTLP